MEATRAMERAKDVSRLISIFMESLTVPFAVFLADTHGHSLLLTPFKTKKRNHHASETRQKGDDHTHQCHLFTFAGTR
jgi:hypothetical protein